MLKNTTYLFGAKVIGYGIRLVVPYFLVRLLTQYEYGSYQQFFLMETIIAMFFQLGANQALFYFIPRDEKNAVGYFLNSVVLNVVVFSLVFCVLSFFRTQVSAAINIPIVDEQFGALAVYTVLIMLGGSCDCYLIARQRVIPAGLIAIGGQILVSAATLIAAVATNDLKVIIPAIVVARGVQLVVSFLVVHRLHTGFKARPFWRGAGEQFRHGVPLGITGLCWTLSAILHKFFVGKLYGTETYAIYAAGTFEIPVFAFFLQSLASVTLGKFATLQQDGDWEGIRELWCRIMTWLYAMVVPMILLFLVVSRPLITFIFPEYEGAVGIFRVNTIAKLALLWNAQLIFRAMGRNDITVYIYLPVIAVSVGAFWFADTLAGMIGIITAQCVMLVAGRLIAMKVLNRMSGHPMPYVVGPGAVFAFYRESFTRVKTMARNLSVRRQG